ncbi:MAG: helix-turn-helix domain-containing protein, partial [Longimicrobiales bacterium]
MGVQERKEREFKRREEEILEAALALFKGDGWQSVTVEQIADRAEIGKGTIYKHFESKDEIYARLVLDYQRTAIEKLRRIDPNVDVIQRLRTIITVTFEMNLAAQEYQRLVQYSSRDEFRNSLSAATRTAFAHQDEAFFGLINAVLEEGVRQSILPRKTPQELLFGPMAAILGARTMMWNECMCPGPQLGPESVKELSNFILAGMLYQEWLAEEGLIDDEAMERALKELEEVQV